MTVAIYIKDGLTQLVLTPENDWERNVIKSVTKGTQEVEIKTGSFYDTRGGWVRLDEHEVDESLILVAKIKPPSA